MRILGGLEDVAVPAGAGDCLLKSGGDEVLAHVCAHAFAAERILAQAAGQEMFGGNVANLDGIAATLANSSSGSSDQG